MFNKKHYMVLGVIVLIVSIVVPVITNYLMFVGNFKVAGDEKTWIGYLGSFWGAIIGGAISGYITLMGVGLTINHAEKIRKQDEYPKKINNLEKLINKLESNLKEIETFLRLKPPFELNNNEDLRLFFIDGNLNIQPTENYQDIVDKFLYELKEIILEIDSKWYKDYFVLREKITRAQKEFQNNKQLKNLWEYAQDYFIEHFEPLTDWKDLIEKHKSEEYNQVYNKIVSNEFQLINEIYNIFSDFKLKAELYQIELVKFFE
jgi:hypothetical protein